MCSCKNNCCCAVEKAPKIETITLDDGRRAERHITVDESGNEVIELFAEEKRPLKLEKRITREMKSVVSKEVHETIKDGEIAFQEVHALEPEVPLQILSRIGVADHNKIVDGDYVRKEEINKMIEEGVVAGVTALMDRMEPVAAQSAPAQPILKAQQLVEQNIEEKKKGDIFVNVIMGIVVVLQAAYIGYIVLM